MSPFEERRKNRRVAADLGARLGFAGGAGFARVRDISSSGVRCLTPHAMAPMTRVELVIALPDGDGTREIVCGGVVVRSVRAAAKAPDASGNGLDGACETAIFFTEIADSDRVDVEEFVSSLARSQGL